jgi:hypothetical protein
MNLKLDSIEIVRNEYITWPLILVLTIHYLIKKKKKNPPNIVPIPPLCYDVIN